MKRCPYCGRYYRQDPRARVQECCGRAECQRARKRRNLRRWRSLHADHGIRYAGKKRAWAKAYPDYWRFYRAGHPDYVARDNLWRAESRRRTKLSANETGFLRRMGAIEDCLRTTAALALSARRNRLDGLGTAAP